MQYQHISENRSYGCNYGDLSQKEKKLLQHIMKNTIEN